MQPVYYAFQDYKNLFNSAVYFTKRAVQQGSQGLYDFIPSKSFKQFRRSIFPANLDSSNPYETATIEHLASCFYFKNPEDFWKKITIEYSKIVNDRGVSEAHAIYYHLRSIYQETERNYFDSCNRLLSRIEQIPVYKDLTGKYSDVDNVQLDSKRAFFCMLLYSIYNYDANSALESLKGNAELQQYISDLGSEYTFIYEDYAMSINLLGLRLAGLKNCLEVLIIPELISPFHMGMDPAEQWVWRITGDMSAFTFDLYNPTGKPKTLRKENWGRKNLKETDSNYNPDEIKAVVQELIFIGNEEIYKGSKKIKSVNIAALIRYLRKTYPQVQEYDGTFTHKTPIGTASDRTLEELLKPYLTELKAY
jgi:hypothetical protein